MNNITANSLVCLPEVIKLLRKHRQMTLQQVAQELGFSSASTISHYENSRRQVPLSVLYRMFELYGFDVLIAFKPNAECVQHE